MKLWLLPFCLLVPVTVAQVAPSSPGSATPGGDRLTFSLDRTGPPLARFQIQLDGGTGHGSYLPGTASGGGSDEAPPGKPIPIVVGAAMLKQLFAAVPAVRGHRCESHSRNLAQTGKKTLTFSRGAAVAECTYNFSDDERVNQATELFEALAQTMDYGERLATKLRFDRLGLDASIDELSAAAKEGRAVELGNIAPVLQAIETDDRVMERVRRKAASLLELAGISSAQPGGAAAASER